MMMTMTHPLTATAALDRLSTALDQFRPMAADPLVRAVTAEVDADASEDQAARALARIHVEAARARPLINNLFHKFVVETIEAQHAGRPAPVLVSDVPVAR